MCEATYFCLQSLCSFFKNVFLEFFFSFLFDVDHLLQCCFCFNVLVFWPPDRWDPSSPPQTKPTFLALEGEILTTRSAGESQTCAFSDPLFVSFDQRENWDLVKTCHTLHDLVMAEQSKDTGQGPLAQDVFHIDFTTHFIANEGPMSPGGHGELRNVSHDGESKHQPAGLRISADWGKPGQSLLTPEPWPYTWFTAQALNLLALLT